jgi:hypothetical protein
VYRISSGTTHGLTDTTAFIRLLAQLPGYLPGELRTFLYPARSQDTFALNIEAPVYTRAGTAGIARLGYL